MDLTYGTVRNSSGSWLIKCEPHVAARLKRVFPRAPQEAADTIRISATPENTRDLEWFLQRYPMVVTEREQLWRLAAQHRDGEERLATLLANHHTPPDIKLALPAREYQRQVVPVIDIKNGLLLADDVGLGKTISAICAMFTQENLPALVVCPAHMPRQWVDQIQKFAPDLRVHSLREGKPYPLVRPYDSRGQRYLWTEVPDVIVTSYHKLRGWAETLAGAMRLVIFDECQQLRHPDSEIAGACKHVALKARQRLGLSATPIYNYGSEFYWVVDVLQPGALGERQEFVREWCTAGTTGDKARIKDTEMFGAYLRREGIMLRRTRRDVGRELPALTRVAHTIDSDERVLKKLTGDAAELAKVILARNERFRGERMRASGEFENLMRQATGIAKAPYVADFVRLLLESGESVVLFGWHREVYRIWTERLLDFDPALYTGTESPKQKYEAVFRFKSGASKLLIMSLRSGAGVDGLQGACRTVVFGELDWSPGVHEQCMGRVHRDGQGDPVVSYYMISEEGSDPIVADVLGVKREQIEGVRNPDQPLVERVETGEDSIRRLARELLERRGETVDEAAATATVTSIHEPPSSEEQHP